VVERPSQARIEVFGEIMSRVQVAVHKSAQRKVHTALTARQGFIASEKLRHLYLCTSKYIAYIINIP
jgi:hypothetical protein